MRELRALALLAAVGLIVFGMIQRDDGRWLACVWGAAPLLLFGLWPRGPRLEQGIRRGVQNLAIVFSVLMLLLSLQLLRFQVVWAEDNYTRTETDEQGLVTSNVRVALDALSVVRGDIIDHNGEVLASSVVPEGGYPQRTYPVADSYNIEAFSNIMGFVSTRFGLSGIEQSYNAYLTGEQGSAWESLNDEIFNRPREGNNVHLTIDARLQEQAYALLNGRMGSVVVLDAETGAIRAMASYPGFDPSQLAYRPGEGERIGAYWDAVLADERRPLLNRPAQGLYAPGSTFKTVTAVAALLYPRESDINKITCPNEFVPENGAPPVVNAVQDEARFTGDPSDLRRVYAFSCNTAFAQYGLRLGAERLEEVAERFHIYSPDDAPDQNPDFDDLDSPASLFYLEEGYMDSDAALAATSYGQGQLLVTPVQMAMVAQAIANNGVMMQPYLVERITAPDGTVLDRTEPEDAGRVMPPEAAAQMKEIMRAVVESGWEGAKVAGVQGILVGGKSGTAEHGVGLTPHAWFIAVAPLDKPRYAVAVMIESGGEGTSVGGQLAGDVLRAAFALEQ